MRSTTTTTTAVLLLLLTAMPAWANRSTNVHAVSGPGDPASVHQVHGNVVNRYRRTGYPDHARYQARPTSSRGLYNPSPYAGAQKMLAARQVAREQQVTMERHAGYAAGLKGLFDGHAKPAVSTTGTVKLSNGITAPITATISRAGEVKLTIPRGKWIDAQRSRTGAYGKRIVVPNQEPVVAAGTVRENGFFQASNDTTKASGHFDRKGRLILQALSGNYLELSVCRLEKNSSAAGAYGRPVAISEWNLGRPGPVD